MIRRRPNQQHHCSLCAGLSAPRERVWWSRTASLMASLLSPASARKPPRGLGGGVGLLFSRGTYSSLYEDASHPSFGDRVRRISEIFADLAGADSTLTSYLQYFRAVSGRIDALRKDALLEVHSESPLAAAQFDDDGLVIVSRSWTAYRVPFASLAEVGSQNAVRPVMLGAIGSFGPDVLMDRIWSVAGEGTFVSVRGGVFQIDKTKVSPRPDIAAQL